MHRMKVPFVEWHLRVKHHRRKKYIYYLAHIVLLQKDKNFCITLTLVRSSHAFQEECDNGNGKYVLMMPLSAMRDIPLHSTCPSGADSRLECWSGGLGGRGGISSSPMTSIPQVLIITYPSLINFTPLIQALVVVVSIHIESTPTIPSLPSLSPTPHHYVVTHRAVHILLTSLPWG